VLGCFICAAAWSQEFRATMIGRVVDDQNAAIVNTRITATQVATGSKPETTSEPTAPTPSHFFRRARIAQGVIPRLQA